MTNAIMEKLSAVLSEQAFYEENKDLSTPDEVIAAVLKKVPEATAEEVDQFLTYVSTQLQDKDELQESDLEDVAGGFAITITVAGVLTAVKVAAAVGTVVGGVVWYWKHRKCV